MKPMPTATRSSRPDFSPRLLCRTAAAVCLLLSIATVSRAQIVVSVSNLTQPNNAGTTSISFNNSSSFQYPTQAFTTGSSATVLSNITLSLGNGSGSGFALKLYSDNAGAPGTLLETLTGSSSPTTAGNYAFTSGASTALSATTTYWWVATTTSGNFNIKDTTSTAETSSTGWTIADSGFDQQNNSGSLVNDQDVFLFSVSTTSAVPEPGTYAAVAGFIALGFAAHRRRRRA